MLDGTNGSDNGNGGHDEIISAHVGTTDWREADRALRGIARRRAALDVDEAGWLIRAQRAEVHRHRGFSSFLEYMERVLGYGPRAALDRLRVASALEHMPALRDALRDGMPFSAVRELVRVVTPDTVAEWIESVRGKSLREIEAQVSGKKRGDGPTEHGDTLRPRVLRLEVAPETYALYLEARRAVATRAGHHLDDDALVNAMCRAALAEGGDAAPGERAGYQVGLVVCEKCRRGWQDGAGTPVEIPPVAVEVAECDAQRIGRLDAATPERATQDITPAVRRLVWRRDHGQCVVPGCRASRNLDLHHIVHREHGGGHDPGNLCLVCSGHHAAHHRGELEIEGVAPALRIRFTVEPVPVREEPDHLTAHPEPALVREEPDHLTAHPEPALVREPPDHLAAHPEPALGEAERRVEGRMAATAPRSAKSPPVADLVRAALVQLGYKPGPAWVAVNRGRAHVGETGGFDALLRAALQEAIKKT